MGKGFNIVVWIVLGLIIAYVLVWLLGNFRIAGFYVFPEFSVFSVIINYWLLIIFWIVIQAIIIFAYFELGKLISKGYVIGKQKILRWSFQLEKYISRL